MRILGIDPGYERLGVAVLEKNKGGKEKIVYSSCFKTSPKLSFAERLNLIGTEVKNLVKQYEPKALAIETLFINTNQKTAMHVAEARGVVIYEAVQAGMEVFEFSPPQIKSSVTGDGSADKAQMLKMVNLLVEIDENKKS